MNRYALRDDQWERIKDLLPGKPGDVGLYTFSSSLMSIAGAAKLNEFAMRVRRQTCDAARGNRYHR
jgi:hypothetical protein